MQPRDRDVIAHVTVAIGDATVESCSVADTEIATVQQDLGVERTYSHHNSAV